MIMAGIIAVRLPGTGIKRRTWNHQMNKAKEKVISGCGYYSAYF
jgi:hypothetical protein